MSAVRIFFIVLLLLPGLTGCSTGESCIKSIQSECTSCHSLNKTCDQNDKSRKYWRRIIDQMNRMNASVSREQKEIIAKCLAKSDSFNATCTRREQEKNSPEKITDQ